MSGAYGGFQPKYRVPKRVQRLTGAITWTVLLGIALVGIPLVILRVVAGLHIMTTLSYGLLIGGGIVLAVLSGWTRYRKPTSTYGYFVILSSLAALAYLGLLSLESSFTYAGPLEGRSVVITIGYGELFLLFALVPLLGLGSGVFFLLQDRKYPGKRLMKDYPA